MNLVKIMNTKVNIPSKLPIFVLASSSSRRISILKTLGLRFKVAKHKFKENRPHHKTLDPKKFVLYHAKKKAYSIKKYYQRNLIISADTIVYLNGEIIGKPKNQNDAKNILGKLSGTKHKVYTGICLLLPCYRVEVSGYEVSTVFTRRLSDEKISVFSKKHHDKAGAYAVQEKKDMFVEKIRGDYYNVVGFPVELFLKLFGQMIIILLKSFF